MSVYIEYRDKEIRDKEYRIERENAPALLAAIKMFSLTDAELAELQAEFPPSGKSYVEKLSAYMESTGKTYKSHAATIRRWATEDRQKPAQKRRPARLLMRGGRGL